MPATEDLDIQTRGELAMKHIPANGGEEFFAGTLVAYDSSGNLVPATNAAGVVFAGLVADYIDNSDGADGDEQVKVYHEGTALLTGSGFSADDVGKAVFVVDNDEIGMSDNASVTSFVLVGWIDEYVSATQVWVRMMAPRVATKRQFTVQIPGTAPGALNLAGVAALHGGSNFYVESVQQVAAINTGTRAWTALRTVTTDYTVGSGAITLVTNETGNTLLITFVGYLR